MIPNIPEDPNVWSWLRVFIYAAFASLGGILGYSMRMLEHGAPIKLTMAIIEGMASGFVGLLMFLACNQLGLSPEWTGVIVGVSGWLGANATLRILEILVYKKLGIEKPEASNDKSVG